MCFSLPNAFMWIISFKPNACVKEFRICSSVLQTRKLRELSRSEVNSDTDLYLPGYGSFHSTTLQSSLKFYFPRFVLLLRVSISETEVNWEHAMIQNPWAISRSDKLLLLAAFLSGTTVSFTPEYSFFSRIFK